MISLTCRVFLIIGYFPFSSLDISCRSLLACKVFDKKSADSPLGSPLYVTFCFFLSAFKIISLFLSFNILIIMCHDLHLLGFILFGTVCASWTWMSISFPRLGYFSAITSSNNFSAPFFCSSSSGTPIILIFFLHAVDQENT